MRTFEDYILEAGGKAPGKMEIVKTSLSDARYYAEMKFAANGFDLDEEVPNFDNNFAIAKAKAIFGRTKRKEMPVLEKKKDIALLQLLLKKGSFDLKGPWSSSDAAKNPFPEGLTGQEADHFIERGLRIYDGSKRDDIVKFKKGSVEVQKLIPIQQQIYFDKSIDKQAKEGRKGSMHFLKNKSTFLASSDLKIIDGHHRFISSILLDPTMKVKILMIDMPIERLLPLTVAFSDALGHKRNG